MNPVLLIAYNNLALTRDAVTSVLAQDIPVDLHFVDNGSTDGTWQWAAAQSFASATRYPFNISPLKIANELAARLFSVSPYVLGVPNDVRLPSNCYRELLRWPRGFVCATDNGQNEPEIRDGRAIGEDTPMAVMLTRKWAYDAIMARDGHFFDEGYFHYASDCDLALRMASCGIRGVEIDIPYWHFRSASHRLALRAAAKAMTDQADRDRKYFESKWGFKVDSLEYGKVASDPNWSRPQ